MIQEPKRVLFVCLGNACRSQMAEAFARAYGSDVLIAASAGLYPAGFVADATTRAMFEKRLDLRDHFSKGLAQMSRSHFDIAIDMTGHMAAPELPAGLADSVRGWDVPDPFSMSYEDHCAVRDEIERLVMALIVELREKSKAPRLRGQGSGRLKL
jgi:protein-tyrosine-phosphatase